MSQRKKHTSSAVGTAGRMFGILLVVLGSIDPIQQLAKGVPISGVQWVLFILVGGIGVGILLLSPLLAHWSQPEPDDQVEDSEHDGDGLYVGDDAGGDAGD